MLGRLDEPSARVERERSAACEDEEGSANESPAAVDARRLGVKAAGVL